MLPKILGSIFIIITFLAFVVNAYNSKLGQHMIPIQAAVGVAFILSLIWS